MRQAGLALILILAGLATASAAENRCGWLVNPTPGNWWLTDRDGTWFCVDRKAGEGNWRGVSRGGSLDRPRFPVAQVDALG